MNDIQLISAEYTKVLEELEQIFWERELEHPSTPPDFPPQAMRASTKIFAAILIDFMWKKQESMGTPLDDRLAQVQGAGEEIRAMVLKYAGLDTHQLYK